MSPDEDDEVVQLPVSVQVMLLPSSRELPVGALVDLREVDLHRRGLGAVDVRGERGDLTLVVVVGEGAGHLRAVVFGDRDDVLVDAGGLSGRCVVADAGGRGDESGSRGGEQDERRDDERGEASHVDVERLVNG